jgi:hypothetical protein
MIINVILALLRAELQRCACTQVAMLLLLVLLLLLQSCRLMYDLPSGDADGSGTLVDLIDDEDLEMMWEEQDVMLVRHDNVCLTRQLTIRAVQLLWGLALASSDPR